MKRCPECRRDYYDDSLAYCLEDGVALVQGLVPSPDEPQTAIFHSTDFASESRTQAQIHTTDKTATLPTEAIDEPKAKGFDKRLILVPLGLIVLVLGGFFGYRYLTTATSGQINSIAVMLFQNTSGDQSMDYLSDGVAESLTNSLSRLGQLKVTAASTMFRFKGRESDPLAVGKELGVAAVLTGKILEQGNRLIINVELVNVADGTQLWGEQYNRPSADILTVQDEIANAVSQKLRLNLSADEKKQLTKRDTESPEAYQLYLKGVYHAAKFSKAELEIGYDYLNQAIAVDPNYTLAYHGLAYYYDLVVDWTMSPDDSMPKAKKAAQREIEIDDTVATGHNDLAFVYWYYDFNWPAAEKEFNRAIELDPSDALTREDHGWFLVTMGRIDEGLAEARKSQQLDPLNQEHTSVLGWDLYLAHRYDESIEQQRKAIELDPTYWPGYSWLGHVLAQEGRYPEAIASFQKAVSIEPVIAEPLMGLARVCAVAGKKDEAAKIIAELNDRSKHPYVSNYLLADMYAGMGDKDKAFAYLEKAYTDRSWYLTHLKLDPELEPLHSDQRFADLVRRVGLP